MHDFDFPDVRDKVLAALGDSSPEGVYCINSETLRSNVESGDPS